jgi:uncharacterized protein with PIN domain
VAVLCRGCGRSYDVSLFAFGRTLHCACGARVGLERPVEPAPGAGPPRFLADAMLGRLARWLRILGFDTAFEAHVRDEDLVRRALVEGRHLLTRDRALPVEWRVGGIHLVGSEELREQLRDVLAAFDLRPGIRPFTRCSVCNTPLAAAARSEVRGRVPARVLAVERDFRACPGCGRVYWRGSHTERMRRVVDELVAEA